MKRLFVFLLLFGTLAQAQIMDERSRAQWYDEMLADRFTNLLPELMDRANIDMWLVISREYNEDPVMKTMLPATWLNARRRTMLLFYRDRQANTIERLAVARYDVGENITSAWDKEQQPDQWARLVELIWERNPQKIGINKSEYFGLFKGIHF